MSHAIENLNIEELQFLLKKELSTQLIDVREIDEHLRFNIGGENIPLSKIEKNFHKLQRKFPIIVYCQKGIRSSKAAEILLKNGYEKVMQLKGGLSALEKIS